MKYEIRIRGRRESIFVDESTGRTLKKNWEDYKEKKVDSVFEVEGYIGSISDIRDFYIHYTGQKDSHNTRPSHWIIMKDDGLSIWKYPFLSKEAALAELSFENLSGYHLEERG